MVDVRLVLCLLLLSCGAAPRQASHQVSEMLAPPPGYGLVWSDEFEEAGLPDSSRWSFDTEFNATGWHNEEKQYYSAGRSENARVEGGRLIIEARAETLDRQSFPDTAGQKFTSARLTTLGKGEWTHGFVEIRAKLPCGRGTWPALWLLPVARGENWENGEIDIMEHVGFQPGMVHHSVHTSAANFRLGNHPSAISKVPDACRAFHDYQLLWSADELVFGVDGQAAFAYRRLPGREWPFDQPFYLLLNLAVGGVWGGAKGIDHKAFPARLEIEHVRVYEAVNPSG
jgi:beta-glucanase (GH16 family)